MTGVRLTRHSRPSSVLYRKLEACPLVLPSVSSALAQVQPADIAEAGDTSDVAGQTETADVPEAGDVADAAEPAWAADTEQQDGDQGGPETPDAPASASK